MIEMMKRAEKVLAATYKRFPVVVTEGKGAELWDGSGKKYLDFVSGIAVCNIGHAHPRIAEVLAKQANTLLHVSNLYYTVPQIELAEWLVDRSFADRVFFCNSGAEANEAAIKLARRYYKKKATPSRYRIVSMKKSFHGRTMATLSATGQKKIREGYDPVLQGFDYAEFNDIKSLEDTICPETCAVMLEPIQGEGGIICPDKDYLKAVSEICRKRDLLLIFDEVQTGLGRTGALFAYEHFDVTPDIMTLAKALGAGLPIGAMLATEKIASAFDAGSHATTFGGGPAITAAALENLKIIEETGLSENSRILGEYFKARLLELKDRYGRYIVDVRGVGLLTGMKLKISGDPIVRAAMEKGFLINCIQEAILRFAPPLIIGEKEIDALLACLDAVFSSISTEDVS